ncbi:cache domain-containing protein [Pseudoduganella sp. LjRoot289]|uniref:cache domain-containing protein n=1 Tax=Pseudoduganella sp. LjRoot289 TaxID=3342314 RepID=UPI003F501D6E
MMKNAFQLLFAGLLALTLGRAAMAQDAAHRGTADEAVAMVKKAGAYMDKNGRDKAVAAFNDPKGEFTKGDLYVFMIGINGDQQGVALAHGQNAKMVGKNLIELNAGGVFPIKEFLKVAASPAGKGWVSYKWPNSVSKNMEDKSTYVEKFGDVLIGVGIYK